MDRPSKAELKQLMMPPGFEKNEQGIRFVYSEAQRLEIVDSIKPRTVSSEQLEWLELKLGRALWLTTFLKKYPLAGGLRQAYEDIEQNGRSFLKSIGSIPESNRAILLEYQLGNFDEYVSEVARAEANRVFFENIRKAISHARSMVAHYDMQAQIKTAEDPVKDEVFEHAITLLEQILGSIPKGGGNPKGPAVRFLQAATTPALVALKRQSGPSSGEAIRSRIANFIAMRGAPDDDLYPDGIPV